MPSAFRAEIWLLGSDFPLGPEELFNVPLAKGRAAAGALAVARLQISADALVAEHVPALGDDDVFLQAQRGIRVRWL